MCNWSTVFIVGMIFGYMAMMTRIKRFKSKTDDT